MMVLHRYIQMELHISETIILGQMRQVEQVGIENLKIILQHLL
jgi:hypothetical protein